MQSKWRSRLNQAEIQSRLKFQESIVIRLAGEDQKVWSQRWAELPQQMVEISRKIVKGAIRMMLRLACNRDEGEPGKKELN